MLVTDMNNDHSIDAVQAKHYHERKQRVLTQGKASQDEGEESQEEAELVAKAKDKKAKETPNPIIKDSQKQGGLASWLACCGPRDTTLDSDGAGSDSGEQSPESDKDSDEDAGKTKKQDERYQSAFLQETLSPKEVRKMAEFLKQQSKDLVIVDKKKKDKKDGCNIFWMINGRRKINEELIDKERRKAIRMLDKLFSKYVQIK